MNRFEVVRLLEKAGFAVVVLGMLLVGASSQARGSIWTEDGDAGSLPGDAQETRGLGSLDKIIGGLDTIDDIDIYAIMITDVSVFSATAVGPGTDLIDTQLFLFDENWLGVAANDDTSSSETNATIPAGHVGAPGLYYLAVSEWIDTPRSSDGAIFSMPSLPGEVVGPAGPGGVSPLADWDVDGFSQPAVEAYTIILDGATFSDVIPEPSGFVVWVLMGLTVFGIALARYCTIGDRRAKGGLPHIW